MKKTNKKLTIEDIFGFTRTREEFNSDIEFLAYVYTSHLDVAGNAYIANRFFESSEFKDLDKTVNEEELPKERFKMIDIYPDFYTNENTFKMIDIFKFTFSKKREEFISEEEYQNYTIKELVKVMIQTPIRISTSPVIRRKERERINKLLNKENKEVIL